jgi:hypothetical protein
MTIRRGGEYYTLYYTHTHKCIHSDEGLYFTRFFFFYPLRFTNSRTVDFRDRIYYYYYYMYTTRLVSHPPSRSSPYSSLVLLLNLAVPPRRPRPRIGIILIYFLTPRPSPESKPYIIIRIEKYYIHIHLYK